MFRHGLFVSALIATSAGHSVDSNLDQFMLLVDLRVKAGWGQRVCSIFAPNCELWLDIIGQF